MGKWTLIIVDWKRWKTWNLIFRSNSTKLLLLTQSVVGFDHAPSFLPSIARFLSENCMHTHTKLVPRVIFCSSNERRRRKCAFLDGFDRPMRDGRISRRRRSMHNYLSNLWNCWNVKNRGLLIIEEKWINVALSPFRLFQFLSTLSPSSSVLHYSCLTFGFLIYSILRNCVISCSLCCSLMNIAIG